MKFQSLIAAALFTLNLLIAPVHAVEPDAMANTEGYAPMAMFAPLDGKTYRGEWTDEQDRKIVDHAVYELILGGRAMQTTHRIEGSAYGGRTIFFYDESARGYVYHYFTTAGFHTTGKAIVDDGVMTTVEQVIGHDTIAEVIGRSTFRPEELRLEVIYVGKDGSRTPATVRVYKPTADRPALF